MTDVKKYEGLPVAGYVSQTQKNLDLVKVNKEFEEKLLRIVDELRKDSEMNGRWLSIAQTHFQEGFMALNRAIFQPTRIPLPEDNQTNG